MKVLNLYSGLGGNRKKWPDYVEVTAVEYREDIAQFYQDQYPQDTVVVGDAHQYLLDHYREFDSIWSSYPCPTHSRPRYWASKGGRYPPEYPELGLYQEIIFLEKFFDGQWVVENVEPYYEELRKPAAILDRHYFWANYHIGYFESDNVDIQGGKREDWQRVLGINIDGYEFQDRTDKLLRNCVHPDLGLHVFESATQVNPSTINQLSLGL